jgi:DNA-binding MarR family transcriptional regulator
VLAQWLGPDALTPGRFQILVVLWAANRPVPQREVVKALGVSRATVSALVETLVKDGYVEITPDPNDKRQVLVELTSTGKADTLRLIRSNTTRLRKSFADFSDADLRILADLLLRLNANLARLPMTGVKG